MANWHDAKRLTGYQPYAGRDVIDNLPVDSFGSAPMDEFGVSGLNRFGPKIYEEWHRELLDRKGMLAYREMRDNEPILWTLLRLYKLLALQAEWRAKSPSDKPEAVRWAEHVEKSMRSMSRMTWTQFIEDALTFMDFGFFFGEEVYEVDEETGLLKWKKISSRSQETLDGWVYDETTREVLGMYQRPNTQPAAVIPRAKALHLVYGYERENPEGRSALRGAYLPYKEARELRRFEGIGFERNVAGMPIALVPPEMLTGTATDDDAATITKIKKLLWQIRLDERMGVVFPGKFKSNGDPSGYELGFASVNGSQAFGALDAAITRREARMAMTLHGEFIMLGMQGSKSPGSYSMHSDKTNHLGMAVDSVLDVVEDGLNQQSVPRLMRYNGVPKEYWPRIEHGDIETENLTEVMNYVTGLFNIGVDLSDEDTQRFLKKLGNLPTKMSKEV